MDKYELGVKAGLVWQTLNKHGSLTFEQLQEETMLSTEMLAAAIGWLARENKIFSFDDEGIPCFYVFIEHYYY